MAAIGKSGFGKSGDVKICARGPFSGMSRADVIRKIIDKKGSLIIGPNKSGKKIFPVSYDSPKDYEPGVITYCLSQGQRNATEKHKTVLSSSIFKSSDFGGGSAGSGGGERATKIQESFQCYICSYVFNTKRGKIEVIPDDKELASSSCANYVHADASLKECLSEITDTWIEEKTYVRTANKLYEEYGSKFTGKVHFHRGSSFMQNLYEAKKKVHRLDRKSKNPQAPGSFNNDKWNPGDIWMSTMNSSSKPLNDCTSWGELKYKVLELADAGKLLGISLKKLEKNVPARIKEFNRVKLPNTSWIQWTWGQQNKFFSSKDMYLTVNGVDIQFRNFGNTNQWQGEVKSTGAAGGKIGGGNVSFYLFENDMKKLFGNQTEEAFYSRLKSSGELDNFIYEGWKNHKPTKPGYTEDFTEEEFMEQLSLKPVGFKSSKAFCIAFLNSAYGSGNDAKRNNLATALYNYASSATDQSSYFIKIS